MVTPQTMGCCHRSMSIARRPACRALGASRASALRLPMLAVAVVAGWLIGDVVPAAAQTSSLFGSQSRSAGTAASSALGGTAGGLGAAGSAGGTVAGTRGAAGQLNTQAGTSASIDTTPSGGFVGRSGNQGRFVGRQEAGTQRSGGGVNFGAFQFGALSNAFGNQFQAGAGRPDASDPRSRIRVQQRLAFEVPARPATSVTAQLRERLSHIAARRPQLAGVQFEIQPDGRVRLTGRAADEHQRRLAELLIRMEPGVSGVINEITVGQ